MPEEVRWGTSVPLDVLSKTNKEVLQQGSLSLLQFFADAVGTCAEKGTEDSRVEQDGARYVSDALYAFMDSIPELRTAGPRVPKDKDRVKFFPGQHKGVVIQLGLPSGETVYMNAYGGGFREVISQDFVDADRALRQSHVSRTDYALSQPMHLNVHMVSPGGEKIVEAWINYTFGGAIRLDNLFVDSKSVDYCPQIAPGDFQYESITSTLHNSLKPLISLIPSA